MKKPTKEKTIVDLKMFATMEEFEKYISDHPEWNIAVTKAQWDWFKKKIKES